jgi:hypothetical protein
LQTGAVVPPQKQVNDSSSAFYKASLVKKRSLDEVEDAAEANSEGSDEIDLSPERCANIIDCVIGEIDDDVLSPPHQKKLKLLPAGI